jgi:hypothetical protein
MGMDEGSLPAGFERCLLTDEEMQLGPEGWRSLSDPFARWDEQAPQTAA